MKKQMLLGTMIMLLAVSSMRGTPYTQTSSSGTAIPGGNPVGVAVTWIFTVDPNAGDTVGGLD